MERTVNSSLSNMQAHVCIEEPPWGEARSPQQGACPIGRDGVRRTPRAIEWGMVWLILLWTIVTHKAGSLTTDTTLQQPLYLACMSQLSSFHFALHEWVWSTWVSFWTLISDTARKFSPSSWGPSPRNQGFLYHSVCPWPEWLCVHSASDFVFQGTSPTPVVDNADNEGVENIGRYKVVVSG